LQSLADIARQPRVRSLRSFIPDINSRRITEAA
jgi:hypothetical protein